jgi:uncharacterized C2H2 Zn-finger protein
MADEDLFVVDTIGNDNHIMLTAIQHTVRCYVMLYTSYARGVQRAHTGSRRRRVRTMKELKRRYAPLQTLHAASYRNM